MLHRKTGDILIVLALLAGIVPVVSFSSNAANFPASGQALADSSPVETRSDFNGDGFDDLAVGVPEEDIGAIHRAGAVNVLYGSGSGLKTSAPADQFWHQNNDGIAGDMAEANDGFGKSLGSGDFNGDGYTDLAIGAYAEGLSSGQQSAGAVVVLYGSSGGLQAASPPSQFWHQDGPNVEDSAEEFDVFGYTLATGDFNGDGYADLAIGALWEQIGTASNAGAVNVLYGSSSGLQTSSPADQFWHQNSPGVEDSVEPFDGFGESLVTGDFNMIVEMSW